jgi:hypothetical protein
MPKQRSAFKLPVRPGLVLPQSVARDFNRSSFRDYLTSDQRRIIRLQLLLQILQRLNPGYSLNMTTLMASAQQYFVLSATNKTLCKLQLLRQIAMCT